MGIISASTIRLNAEVADKEDAIRQAGQLLVQGGCVAAPYVDGMVARESTMSTYLGYGICIPHGQYEDHAHILRTGISALQIPQGIEWEPGEIAYLIIGIAASGDEHLGVMSNLAEVIEDPAAAEQLVRAADPAEIIDRLNRIPAAEA